MSDLNRFIPVCEPTLDGNEIKYVNEAVSSGWISSSGKYVGMFESAFSEYCGCSYGVAVCNGTMALHLALRALGIGKGDEVIIPAFTMIATAFAVCYTGAMPVFVDVDKETWNIDTSKIEEKITNKTKAIIPVHIFGNPCNMDAITKIAKQYNLFIVEDAAEAHGAEYNGKKAGSFSDIGCFSFFANKNLTTGEGGMVVTNNPEYYDRCKYFRNMSFPLNAPRTYLHEDIGYNYRMSNIHAAIGLAQTERADYYRSLRINNANRYFERLKECKGIIFQKDEKYGLNVHWMNSIIVNPELYGHSRDDLIVFLKERGIDTRLLFNSMARQKAMVDYGCDCSGLYTTTDWLSDNGLYLPSASKLDFETIDYICNCILEYGK